MYVWYKEVGRCIKISPNVLISILSIAPASWQRQITVSFAAILKVKKLVIAIGREDVYYMNSIGNIKKSKM